MAYYIIYAPENPEQEVEVTPLPEEEVKALQTIVKIGYYNFCSIQDAGERQPADNIADKIANLREEN